MSLQYSTTHRTNDMTDVVTQAGATAFLAIFTGAPPATCATASSGTLAVSLPLSNPIGTVTNGVLTFSAITPTNAVASVAGGYFRIFPSAVTSGTNAVTQGTVAVSGADINFAGGIGFVNGTQVQVPSLSFTSSGA